MNQFIQNNLILLIIAWLTHGGAQKLGASCNDGGGECKSVTACPAVANYFSTTFHKIKFCDDSLVCCPKAQTAATQSSPEDESKLFARECRSYRDAVYRKCDPKPLIVSGTKAEPREFPHMALLGFKNEEAKLDWFCGGTLISPKYVLSAAHCFYDRNIPNIVRLGELDYNSRSDDAQTQDIDIKNYIPHPDYDYHKHYNDIVLVELDGVAVLNRYVAPACLPISNGTEYAHFIATGWGSTKVAGPTSTHLLKVKLERFDDDECKEFIEPTENLDAGLRVRTQLCAGSRTDKRDTCTGDSGGPLFVEHPDYPCMYLLVGITSFGNTCGAAGSPGVYVRVNLYVDWIEKIAWNATARI